jgi:spermidine synthase
MSLDPVALARECSTAQELDAHVLAWLEREVGFDVAFAGMRGEEPTAGGRCSLMAYLVLRGEPIGVLVLGRTGSAVSASDVATVERILPALAAALASRREHALFIGCGGAVAPRRFAETYPGIAHDVVESDPAVVALARTHYAIEEVPRLAVHVADGVAFVREAACATWDVAVIDAYDAGDLASGFGTPAFFASLERALRPGGAFAFNVVGALDGGAVQGVVAAAASAFDDVRVVPVMVPGEAYSPRTVRNVVVVGTKLTPPRAAAW